jgi:hypothetical protein
MFAAVSGAIGLSVLSGCGNQQFSQNPNDQARHYLANASGRYVVPGPPNDPWGPYIREASQRFDIPEPWIRGLMRQESGGNLYRNGRLITSGAGAMGLMQVMPGTYAELRARHNLGPDPFDPHENIMAGVAYMREMYDMYGSPGFLAAYNAGPNRLDDYLSNQRGLPDETRHYVAAIAPSLRYGQPVHRSPAEQFAMNQIPANIPPGPRFGYGSASIPTMQLASARPSYAPAAYTPPAPVYQAPAPQPRAVAWAEPPRPQYTAPAAAPAPQPRAVAWAEPPRPAAAPAPFQKFRDEDEDESPAHHASGHATTSHTNSQVALAIPPVPPTQHSGGGLHLISSAMAAESYPVHHHGKSVSHASYTPEHAHGGSSSHGGSAHASANCHPAHGRTGCGKS